MKEPTSSNAMTDQNRGEKPTQNQIAALAYQFYLENGRQEGREMEDWLRAERTLMQRRGRSTTEALVGPARSQEVRPVVPQAVSSTVDPREYPFARDERGSASREEIRRQQIPRAARQSQRPPERSNQAR